MSNILKVKQTELSPFVGVNNDSINIIGKKIDLSVSTGSESINQLDVIFSGYKNIIGGTEDTQTFMPSTPGLCSAISIHTNASTYGILMRVYLRDSVGNELNAAYFNLPVGVAWTKFTFVTPTFLDLGEIYTIGLSPNGLGDIVPMGYDTTGSYPNGNMGSDNSKDYMFRVYMVGTSFIKFPEGNIQDLTQDIPNNISNSIVTSTQAINTFVSTRLSETADFYTIQGNLTTSTWYLMGYCLLMGSQYFQVVLEAYVTNKTSGAISHVKLTAGWNGTTTIDPVFEILSGKISAIRPFFRMYLNSSNNALYFYVKLPSNCIFSLSTAAYLSYPKNFSSLGTYLFEGTGSNPTDATGKTLKYDTAVDDAGYYAPKTVNWTGPFATSPQQSIVSFSIDGAFFKADFENLSATGVPPQTFIVSEINTIPSKWMPRNLSINNVPVWRMCGVDAGNMVEATGNITISLDGKITISKNLNNFFNPGNNPCGFYRFSCCWEIKNT